MKSFFSGSLMSLIDRWPTGPPEFDDLPCRICCISMKWASLFLPWKKKLIMTKWKDKNSILCTIIYLDQTESYILNRSVFNCRPMVLRESLWLIKYLHAINIIRLHSTASIDPANAEFPRQHWLRALVVWCITFNSWVTISCRYCGLKNIYKYKFWPIKLIRMTSIVGVNFRWSRQPP